MKYEYKPSFDKTFKKLELDRKKNRDPLEILAKKMFEQGIKKDVIEKVDAEVKSEIEDAVSYSQSLPEIDTGLALKDVFIK